MVNFITCGFYPIKNIFISYICGPCLVVKWVAAREAKLTLEVEKVLLHALSGKPTHLHWDFIHGNCNFLKQSDFFSFSLISALLILGQMPMLDHSLLGQEWGRAWTRLWLWTGVAAMPMADFVNTVWKGKEWLLEIGRGGINCLEILLQVQYWCVYIIHGIISKSVWF